MSKGGKMYMHFFVILLIPLLLMLMYFSYIYVTLELITLFTHL